MLVNYPTLPPKAKALGFPCAILMRTEEECKEVCEAMDEALIGAGCGIIMLVVIFGLIAICLFLLKGMQ